MGHFTKRQKDDGRGRTKDDAIVINASNSVEGIDREYKEIEAHFGKINSKCQILYRHHGPHGDSYIETFLLQTKSGQVELNFDISSFFGRTTDPQKRILKNIIAKKNRDAQKVAIEFTWKQYVVKMRCISLALEYKLIYLNDLDSEIDYNSIFQLLFGMFDKIKDSDPAVVEVAFNRVNWALLAALLRTVRQYMDDKSKVSEFSQIADSVILKISDMARVRGLLHRALMPGSLTRAAKDLGIFHPHETWRDTIGAAWKHTGQYLPRHARARRPRHIGLREHRGTL